MAYGTLQNYNTQAVTAECNSASSRIQTEFVTDRGHISKWMSEQIAKSLPFWGIISKTKEFFPEGQGDFLKETILTGTGPSERDVLDWQRIKEAEPGYNPCCMTSREISYGSRTVNACLYGDAWHTPPFCKTDLAFKTKRSKQMSQFRNIMLNHTKDIWSHWSWRAYQRSVQCQVLCKDLHDPSDIGRYPNVNPTSGYTYEHSVEIGRNTRDANGPDGSIIPNFEMIFIDPENFEFLKDRYLQARVERGLRFTNDINSMMLKDASLDYGEVHKIGRFLYCLMDTPRYRKRQNGESWDDALIPSTVNVPTERGVRKITNPDYRNGAIAQFTEICHMSLSAAAMLVPPAAMVTQENFLGATDYAGEFNLINIPDKKHDPRGKMIWWLAEFMSGMISRFPEKARMVLARCAYSNACDVDVPCGPEQDEVDNKTYIANYCPMPLTPGQMQIQTRGSVDECPEGASLFLVTKGGRKYLVASIDASADWAGDRDFPGTGKTLQVTLADPAAAVVRDCDPFDHVACLSSQTQVDSADDDGCAGCGGTPADPNDVDGDGIPNEQEPYFAEFTGRPTDLIVEGSGSVLEESISQSDGAAEIQAIFAEGLNVNVAAGAGDNVEVTNDGDTWIVQIVWPAPEDDTIDSLKAVYADASQEDGTNQVGFAQL